MTAKKKKWLLAIAVTVGVGLTVLFVAAHQMAQQVEPYIHEQAVQFLEKRFDSDVTIGGLRVKIRDISPLQLLRGDMHAATARVEGENIVLRHKGRTDIPPLFVMRRFSFEIDLRVLFDSPRRVPIVTIGTNSRSGREAITPRGIARGAGDRYLRSLNRAIHTWGGPVIFRPLAEMNGHWTYYSAYNANGSHRGKAHSQKNFRRAFKRIYLILHGGDRASINRKLANSRMPGISVDLPENPRPRLRVLWNPQGFGSPDVPGNRAHVYYPGDAFVDIVGNDIYDIRFRYAWDANRALFRRYRHKPYALGEFGLWGIDDPSFIRRVGRFIRTHSRVKLAIYYDSQRGSIWDLGSKPRSRAAYRRYITPLNR